MNEAINDSTKLVAQALKVLKEYGCSHCTKNPSEEVIFLLELALEKLASNIGQ